MNWNNVSLVVLGLTAFGSAFGVALWVALVIWTFRDMRARTRDAFAQLLASLMVLVLGPFGAVLYFVLRPRETLAEKYERSLEEEALLQDIEGRSICPGCKQPIEPDFVVCPVCHTRLRQPCVHCGRLIHPRWTLCPYCAQSQKPVPGAERVGRVTLQDLEGEEEEGQPEVALPEDVAAPWMDGALVESYADDAAPVSEQADAALPLEDEGLPDLDRIEFEIETDEGWDALGEDGGADPTTAEPRGETFVERDAAEVVEDRQGESAPKEPGDEDENADDSARRPLSLFRRG